LQHGITLHRSRLFSKPRRHRDRNRWDLFPLPSLKFGKNVPISLLGRDLIFSHFELRMTAEHFELRPRRSSVVGRGSRTPHDHRSAQLRRADEKQQQRTVPIPAALVSILRAHRLADPWQWDLVFPNGSGEMYSRNAKLEELLRRALNRAKLPRIRVHDLRHIFASHFVMGGGNIFTLQRILGHCTPQLTSDTCAHVSPRHLAGEADRVAYPEPVGPARVLPFAAGRSMVNVS
jgi:Phage integrase family